ncbi:Acetyltransferase (GNAT) domain-containing protein [Pseudomonas antarctica]|uniref:Acetyltransferase (GNAT) domain-containing protein n=1 Tax=Pseudomonas antarctica TaxID=219572 RepID=A0A1G9ZZQ4_9PSED|nr:GNAT family N-acetyltransferase [Pseudomonas antarctica]KAF2407033.1 acetyltransferase (GNAT) family protein [Pseudomonas antarctica]SDN26778.1 Acetyltransferase (GNAT) domain-containing protein [Pseudomonas antarctica]
MTQASEDFSIRKLEALPEQLRELEAQAVAEGFRFLTRLITEWENCTNRFDQPGECLVGVFRHGQWLAVGGLSRDPYAGPETARLPRVYVDPTMRKRRIGGALVRYLLEYAAKQFQAVRLSTESPSAMKFYLRCGFHPVGDDTATHAKSLTPLNRQ